MSTDRTVELRRQAEEQARHFLVRAGFNVASLSPRAAWEARASTGS
jgi:hypothetical protein